MRYTRVFRRLKVERDVRRKVIRCMFQNDVRCW